MGDGAGYHQHSSVSSKADVGEHVFVGPFTSIGDGAIVGDGCLIGAGVIIESGVSIGARGQIAPGCILRRGLSIEDDVKLGAGTITTGRIRIFKGVVIQPGCTLFGTTQGELNIDQYAVVEAGSIIDSDVPPGEKPKAPPKKDAK